MLHTTGTRKLQLAGYARELFTRVSSERLFWVGDVLPRIASRYRAGANACVRLCALVEIVRSDHTRGWRGARACRSAGRPGAEPTQSAPGRRARETSTAASGLGRRGSGWGLPLAAILGPLAWSSWICGPGLLQGTRQSGSNVAGRSVV